MAINHIIESLLGIKELKVLDTYRAMVAEAFGTLILVFVGVGKLLLLKL